MNEAEKQIAEIREAIEKYYFDLDMREHGDIAQSRAFHKIEKALGMTWIPGEQKVKRKCIIT